MSSNDNDPVLDTSELEVNSAETDPVVPADNIETAEPGESNPDADTLKKDADDESAVDDEASDHNDEEEEEEGGGDDEDTDFSSDSDTSSIGSTFSPPIPPDPTILDIPTALSHPPNARPRPRNTLLRHFLPSRPRGPNKLPPELLLLIFIPLLSRRPRHFILHTPDNTPIPRFTLPVLHFGDALAFAKTSRHTWKVLSGELWKLAVQDIPALPVEWTFHRAAGCGNLQFLQLALDMRPELLEGWEGEVVEAGEGMWWGEDGAVTSERPGRALLPGSLYRRPAFVAARYGRKEVYDWLLENGDSWEQLPSNPHGITALTHAAVSGSLQMVKTVMESMEEEEYPADFNDPGFSHNPLQWAACAGDLELVKFLVSRRADTNFCLSNGEGLLHWLSSRRARIGTDETLPYGSPVPQHRQLAVASWLLSRGLSVVEDPSFVTDDGARVDSPLAYCLKSGNAAMLQLFLSPTYFPPSTRFHNTQTDDTLLHLAARIHPRLHGARTTPQMAAYGACLRLVLRLAPSHVKTQNRRGESPLHTAVVAMNIMAVRLLLRAGAPATALTRSGLGCGHLLVKAYGKARRTFGWEEVEHRYVDLCAYQILDQLIGYGGLGVLYGEHHGKGSALVAAVRERRWELIAMMVLMGGDPFREGRETASAYDVAEEEGWEDGKVRMMECWEESERRGAEVGGKRGVRGWLKRWVWEDEGEGWEVARELLDREDGKSSEDEGTDDEGEREEESEEGVREEEEDNNEDNGADMGDGERE